MKIGFSFAGERPYRNFLFEIKAGLPYFKAQRRSMNDRNPDIPPHRNG